MKTQVEQAKDGIVTQAMEAVARAENMDTGTLVKRVADGSAVIMSRSGKHVGIGKGLVTKVNVNLGTSSNMVNPEEEVKKALVAEKYGADTITDLSMGGDITKIRKTIFENTTLPITTVPLYQTVVETGLRNMAVVDILDTIRQQAKEGVSSFVLHCIDRKTLDVLEDKHRVLGVVSKGGSITAAYMMLNKCENPFIENFGDILEILKKHDIVLSLGNTMRSGCIHDTRDGAQLGEIRQNVELAKRANEKGVQVIIEGMGGHVRADRIAEYVKFHKQQADYPLFVAGPLRGERCG